MTHTEAILDSVRADGGATLDLNGNSPTAGWCVGDPAYSQTVEHFSETDTGLLLKAISDYVARVPRGRYFGLWIDSLDTLWLDIVDIIDNAADALSLGRLRGELAIYNLSDGQTMECA